MDGTQGWTDGKMYACKYVCSVRKYVCAHMHISHLYRRKAHSNSTKSLSRANTMSTYVHTCIHTYICIHIHTYIHTYINTLYIHINVCIYIYTSPCSYPCIHAYIHEYMQKGKPGRPRILVLCLPKPLLCPMILARRPVRAQKHCFKTRVLL